jgi:alkanesulfonate monooxygenase SsuD/methylene tetrahydromethanopterin reductase-like flavin-dependent oxidoreductase (luciferase family)
MGVVGATPWSGLVLAKDRSPPCLAVRLAVVRGMVERSRYVEELGFDWVSVSEHHYSPRILTPSLPIAAA